MTRSSAMRYLNDMIVIYKMKFFGIFQLALVQTRHVIAQLRRLNPDRKFEIRKIVDFECPRKPND